MRVVSSGNCHRKYGKTKDQIQTFSDPLNITLLRLTANETFKSQI